MLSDGPGREAGATAAPRKTAAGWPGAAPGLLAPAPRRVVLDTNVLVSLYVFADSRFAPLRARIECREWLALTNDACIGEFRRVLGYPAFAMTEERQQLAFAAYDANAMRAPQCGGAIAALPRCKDRDDQKFLELARDGHADWLVTADKALLRLAGRKLLHGLFRILPPERALSEG